MCIRDRPQPLRHQRYLQLRARALDVERQPQSLALQLANEPGAQATAVGVKDPAPFRCV